MGYYITMFSIFQYDFENLLKLNKYVINLNIILHFTTLFGRMYTSKFGLDGSRLIQRKLNGAKGVL